MIHFHPNAFDTLRLGNPAKHLLHATIALGIEQGDGSPHRVPVVDLLRLAGLPSASKSLIRDLLTECTKALALLDSDDEDDNGLDASCPVFEYVYLCDGEVNYRLAGPVYSLSAFELRQLLSPPLLGIVRAVSADADGQAESPRTALGSGEKGRRSGRIKTASTKGVDLSIAPVMVPGQPVDLSVAIRVLCRLAHEDGDLGAAYWNSVVNLLKAADSMHAELMELRQRARKRR